MADVESWSSSEDNWSEESDENLVNLYDSDVENSVGHSGSRPYQFEPRRVRQNEQQEASPEPYHRRGQQLTQTVLETQTGIKSFCN